MSATDIKAALQRAAESGSSELITKIVQSPPGRLKKMTKDYNNKTSDVKTKTIMKRKLGLASRRDYLTLYIVYRSIFPYMNLDLYKSLLRELSLDTRLKQFRKSLKASMSTNQRKRQRGGFIFSAIIASIAAAIAGAAATTAATVATTAATVGTAIAGSTVASAVVGGVATAAATASAKAIVDAIKKK